MLWITGANGLVGSALSKICPNALKTGREVHIGNEREIEAFLNKNPAVSHIINCAAFSNVDAAEEFRNEAYLSNVVGPEHLGRTQIPWIHISTDYVFEGFGKTPLKESDLTAPLNYYGETKLLGEKRALDQGACVVRTSWVFGLNGKNFVSKLMQMFQTEEEIYVANDQWSRFTYAPDLARALLKMVGQKGLYQYANEGVTTKYEFALLMLEKAKKLKLPVKTVKIVPVSSSLFPAKCKRPVYSALDTSKIKSFTLIRSWQEALEEFLCTF